MYFYYIYGMGKCKQIHIEEYNQAKVKYLSGNYSITKLAKEYNLDIHWLSKRLKEDNITIINKHNSLKFDNTIFDNINTSQKAYWLGFLYADGYISNGEKTNNIELSLKLSDKDHLEKYKKFLKAENKVKTDHFRCRFTISNKYLRDKLVSIGCTNNKSLILKFPNIKIFKSPKLIKDFIRGYVDGDGCLCIVKGIYPQLSILGTKEFLTELQKYLPLDKHNKLKLNDYKSSSNTYVLTFNGNTAIKVSEYLYKKSKIKLLRKYLKYKDFCRLK